MSEHASFFTYSPCESGRDPEGAHILFHATQSHWLAVNETTLRIARHFADAKPMDELVRLMAAQYGIPLAVAERDILYVWEQLSRQHFLGSSGPEKATRSPVLRSVFVHTTNRCNLRCPHCYISSGEGLEDLPASLFCRIVDELGGSGRQNLVLSGGEPLLHPEIKTLLEYAAPRIEGIRLLTNGTLIDENLAAFLAQMDITIQISIDGSKKEIHDLIRGAGTFDRALRGLSYLKAAGHGKRLNFCTTVMSRNLHDLPQIIALAESLDVPLVRFLSLRNVGRAAERWSSIGLGVNRKDYEEFYRYVSVLQTNRACSVDINCGLGGFLLKMPEGTQDDIWCTVGTQLAVAANGDTYPCVCLMQDEFLLGNAFHQSLMEMLHSDRMTRICSALSERRTKIQKCAACHWRNLCQAGCMGQALDNKGTIWDTDDFCDYRGRAYEAAFDKILGSVGF